MSMHTELITLNRRDYIQLREALKACADDLEAEVTGKYAGTLDYPSQKRRYDRDMESVLMAREALARSLVVS